MKLTKITYLDKTFNLAKNCDITQCVRGCKPKTSYNEQENQFFGLIFRIFRLHQKPGLM